MKITEITRAAWQCLLFFVVGVVAGYVLLVGGRFVVRLFTDDNEISDRQYLEVENVAHLAPELSSLLDEIVADGRITNKEYRDFERQGRDLLRQGLEDAGRRFKEKRVK